MALLVQGSEILSAMQMMHAHALMRVQNAHHEGSNPQNWGSVMGDDVSTVAPQSNGYDLSGWLFGGGFEG